MFRQTVSNIVSNLEAQCSELEALAGNLRSRAAQKKQKAEALLAKHDDHHAEADRAERVAAKVKSLLD